MLILLLFPATCFPKLDSIYVRDYSQELSVRAYMGMNFITMSQNRDSEPEENYLSNKPPSFGLGLSLKNTIISFGVGYGFDFLRDKSKGKTSAKWDLQFRRYTRYVVFDLFYQEYKGFYQDNDKEKDYKICSDLKIRKLGAFGQYIFNNKRFSYKAAFSQNQKQLRSAGSFLLGAEIYNTWINSDSSFVYNNKKDFSSFQFGVNAGYAHTWVLNRYWHISGSMSMGINLASEKFRTFGRSKISLCPSIMPRIAAGYDRNNWALGFAFASNILFHITSKNNNMGIQTGSAEVRYIRRFNFIPFRNKKEKMDLKVSY